MGFIFFDDSQHAAAGFHLGALVCTEADPTPQIDAALRAHGLEPGQDEFKSRTATADPARAALREAMRSILGDAVIGVAVVPTLAELGPAGLHLLAQMAGHGAFPSAPHQVFFDRNMFRPIEAGVRLTATMPALGACTLHLEQDSRIVRGIQLADLAASICAAMLKEKLGLITKRIVLNDEGRGFCDDEVSLGFDLWSSIRQCFLRDEALDPDDPATMDARAGLYIASSAGPRLLEAALERFGTVYVGCIH